LFSQVHGFAFLLLAQAAQPLLFTFLRRSCLFQSRALSRSGVGGTLITIDGRRWLD
jgi:hypothetical protein